jgi:hypothetical protein
MRTLAYFPSKVNYLISGNLPTKRTRGAVGVGRSRESLPDGGPGNTY